MKVFCLTLCIVLCFGAAVPSVAAAESVDWVRIVEDGVYLFANSDNSKRMFLLEKSYYLRVVGEENNMYLVSVMENEEPFPQILGYVWKREVEKCDKTPVPPYYPTVRITVNTDSAQVKLSPVPSAETVITVTNTQVVSYYGKTVNYGSVWYYVYFGGKFGYVYASNVTTPVIALHPTPIVQEVVAPTTPQPEEPLEEPVEQNSTGEIFLIIFVAVLGLGIALALFLPGNTKKHKEVFDKDI